MKIDLLLKKKAYVISKSNSPCTFSYQVSQILPFINNHKQNPWLLTMIIPVVTRNKCKIDM